MTVNKLLKATCWDEKTLTCSGHCEEMEAGDWDWIVPAREHGGAAGEKYQYQAKVTTTAN